MRPFSLRRLDADKTDANEAATTCTTEQIRQYLIKSAFYRDQDISRLKVDDVRYARSGRGLSGLDSRDKEPMLRITIQEVVTRSTAIEYPRDELRPSTQVLQFGQSLKDPARMRL